ncbi:MAG: gluconate 2-dehydrogenase subunit 3 family protein [Actinobacteria bacterium]|nr:MAG: gluconate 2-dehydrogenase subunit 3 family protein [Actinomycetota bacterium]
MSVPEGLPRQRRGIAPQMLGRYPDWNVLEQSRHWDDKTREVVMKRVESPPHILFFTEDEAETLKAYCDTITYQYTEPRIPVLSFIDEKLLEGRLDGYQYEDMPDDRDAWRLVAAGLEYSARAEWAAESFARAPEALREDIVAAFADGLLRGGPWEQLNVKRAFKLTTKHICQAFYAHPWAWNEIGFGGPSYPRGYAAFGADHLLDRERWEPKEEFVLDPVQDTKARGID